MNLDGKRLLITGALTHRSIAFAVAEQAQLAGAEVVLTGLRPRQRLTERAAKRLPEPADVLELDVNSPDDLRALREELEYRWERVDGVLHAIAFAPDDALGGRFLETPAESAAAAFTTSAFSLKALTAELLPLMEEGVQRGRARLRRHRRVARLRLDGRLQGRPRGRGPLPGPRPRPPRRAREPRLRRAARDAGRGRHPRLRPPRRRVGRPRAARLGRRATR